ncbi:MAG TPA: hypothetical protein VNC50_19685, partial [Planctomycetia bacterium]|nr:hypothetical protein [Planctomycetia bacterium]
MNRRTALGLMAGAFVPAAGRADDEGAEEYEKLCQLPDGECIKRIAPPFPASRLAFYFKGNPAQARAIPRGPNSMWITSKDRAIKLGWCMFGAPTDLEQVLGFAVGAASHEIVGDVKLRKRVIDGDWVIRDGATPEKTFEDLEHLLATELKWEISLAYKAVERPVYVATGTYKFTPTVEGRKEIDVYGSLADPSRDAGNGKGDFAAFLRGVGAWIGKPIVNEAAGTPTGDLAWRFYRQTSFRVGQTQRDDKPEFV